MTTDKSGATPAMSEKRLQTSDTPTSSDVVEMLRVVKRLREYDKKLAGTMVPHGLLREAADLIERLAKERDEAERVAQRVYGELKDVTAKWAGSDDNNAARAEKAEAERDAAIGLVKALEAALGRAMARSLLNSRDRNPEVTRDE